MKFELEKNEAQGTKDQEVKQAPTPRPDINWATVIGVIIAIALIVLLFIVTDGHILLGIGMVIFLASYIIGYFFK